MPIHDYQCESCGHTERNLWFRVADIPRVKKCPACGKVASKQIFDQAMRAQPNWYSAEMGYGQWHPQLGMVLESYGHKQELMRKWGLEEGSDPVGGNRKLSEEAFDSDSQPDPGDAGCFWGDREDLEKALKDPNGKTEIKV